MHGRADLHVHSVWSDGAQRPEAIVNAVRGRLDVVAITDHDEVRGALRAREWALGRPELGVDVVVGEEISKRTLDVRMVAPHLLELPPGTFHRWMRETGKLGDQHKVPRVMNDRAVTAALLAAVGARDGEPLVHSGS